MDLYDREKATRDLENLRRDLANFKEIEDNSVRIRSQIQSLEVKPKAVAPNVPILITGYLTFLTL